MTATKTKKREAKNVIGEKVDQAPKGKKGGQKRTPRAGEQVKEVRKMKSGKPVKAESEKKMSALDAAAKVLEEAGEPMNAKDMIEAMAAEDYWKSPGGKTPHATLYSAILREIDAKGKDARFKKTDRGQFTSTGKE
jgi:hypothetical protein